MPRLALEQAGHIDLRHELAEWRDGDASSALLAVEAIRACARYEPEYAREARAWLEGVALLAIDDSVLNEAALLDPPALRSLGAIHLATALSVRDEIGTLFTYDDRLAGAAERHGLSVAWLRSRLRLIRSFGPHIARTPEFWLDEAQISGI